MTTPSYIGDMDTHPTPQVPRSQVQTAHALTPQQLAEAVADDGFDAHAEAVASMVADAQRFGICGVLASITLDAHQPTVARERAFGRLVATYTRAIESQVTLDPAPAGERFTVAA